MSLLLYYITTICRRIFFKITAEEFKNCPLPVDVRRSKTSLFKLLYTAFATLETRKKLGRKTSGTVTRAKEKTLANRDFKIQQRDGNDKESKKKKAFISRTTTLQVHHAFLYISLPFLSDYDVKRLCFMENVNRATRKFYFAC